MPRRAPSKRRFAAPLPWALGALVGCSATAGDRAPPPEPAGARYDRTDLDAALAAERAGVFLGTFALAPKAIVDGDTIKVQGWFSACRKLRVLPPIDRLCRLARHSYNVPDDFDDRLRALEQLYRDTAGEVIPLHRLNFIDASGNDAADGNVREVGLDYNHGHNAGWDPRAGQFVLFDW